MLVFWLHREGKREGYPLVSDRSDRPNFGTIHGFPETPPPKVFLLHHPHGATVTQGQNPERDITGLIVENPYNGSPFDPKGDPMKDGIGAASYAMRADTPDLAFDDNLPKIVPLRAAPGWTIPEEDPDPRGKSVTTLDGETAAPSSTCGSTGPRCCCATSRSRCPAAGACWYRCSSRP